MNSVGAETPGYQRIKQTGFTPILRPPLEHSGFPTLEPETLLNSPDLDGKSAFFLTNKLPNKYVNTEPGESLYFSVNAHFVPADVCKSIKLCGSFLN